MTTTKGKVNAGHRKNFYKPCPKTIIDKDILKAHGLDGEFECISVGNENGQVALIPNDEENAESNAELIVEAFNVTNEIGYTPRQLAEQKSELSEALIQCRAELLSHLQYQNNPDSLSIKMADEAIKNAEK